MKCIRNGVGARWSIKHYYPGDAFVCPTCRRQIIKTNSNSTVDDTSPGLQMDDPPNKKYMITEGPLGPEDVEPIRLINENNEESRREKKTGFNCTF